MPAIRRALTTVALLAVTGVLAPAHAEDAVDLAKAKAEGKVIWYTSTPIDQAQKIVNLFKTQTGISVELFRSGGSRHGQEGLVRGVPAEEFRQHPRCRQGAGRQLRGSAAQYDDALSAQRQSR